MTVTIASVRAQVPVLGVEKLLVYCLGKREGDWPCNHQSTLPVNRFQATECLRDIEQRCRCTVCGWRRAELRPDYSVRIDTRASVGWMVPPSDKRSPRIGSISR